MRTVYLYTNDVIKQNPKELLKNFQLGIAWWEMWQGE